MSERMSLPNVQYRARRGNWPARAKINGLELQNIRHFSVSTPADGPTEVTITFAASVNDPPPAADEMDK
jgi:hypothetical protein